MDKNNKITQEWFEMKKEQSDDLNKKVWVPLKAYQDIEKIKTWGKLGYKEDSHIVNSVLIAMDKKNKLNELSWNSFVCYDNSSIYIDDNNNYFPAEFFGASDSDEITGINPILVQSFNNSLPSVWSINQDIILALNLYKENNYWLSPDENYDQVIRISYDENKNPYSIEIKNKYLKDYLKARNMGLYIATYTSHDTIMQNREIVNWGKDTLSIDNIDQLNSHWRGLVREIDKNGMPYGEKAALIQMERTDNLENDDIPILKFPTEDNEKSQYSERTFDGEKNFRIEGELWKNHWITPANKSIFVGNDEPNYPIYYIAEADGSQISKEKLKEEGRWLWFSPKCICSLLEQRDGFLKWLTKDTGRVGAKEEYLVHFGVNNLGLINVYAKDISYLPLWQQKIWVSFNVQPEGGVSKELLMSQVKAIPAATQAPEKFIIYGNKYLSKEFLRLYNFPFFNENLEYKDIIKKLHRFRSLSEEGFYELATDLTKISIELINTKAIKKIIQINSKDNLGSIKILEQYLIQKLNFNPTNARNYTSILAGINELRIRDSHIKNLLKEKDKIELYKILNIDSNLSYIDQGYSLLSNYCSFIFDFVKLLRQR